MTNRTRALRYRIWAYASPRGWDCTIAEVADALGEAIRTVSAISIRAGWASRFREARTAETNGGLSDGYLSAMECAREVASGRVGVDE